MANFQPYIGEARQGLVAVVLVLVGGADGKPMVRNDERELCPIRQGDPVDEVCADNVERGVAVFGGDGRLKLHNPGFARIWKLEAEQLDGDPHIADILEMTKTLYEFGDDWDAYKARIITHTTERTPSFNRLDRTDESVLEWASVPLPDVEGEIILVVRQVMRDKMDETDDGGILLTRVYYHQAAKLDLVR